jgi:hypothetical protein
MHSMSFGQHKHAQCVAHQHGYTILCCVSCVQAVPCRCGPLQPPAPWVPHQAMMAQQGVTGVVGVTNTQGPTRAHPRRRAHTVA